MKSKGCNDIMDKKVIGGYCVCFLLIIILLLFMISGNSSPYGIKNGDIHLEVQDNGLLKVQEVYIYTIKETVDTINRTIERDNGENISNLKVYTSGAYSEFNIEENSNSTNITTFLYKDESKNQKINNKEITVVYESDLTQALKLYNDVGIFQYKLYDNKEVVPINNLSFKINYPSKEGVNFWINPYDVAENTKFHWENSSLIIENISTNFMTNNIEFSSTIPKNEFSINNTYATIIDDTKAEDITKAQENYENNYSHGGIGGSPVGVGLRGVLEAGSIIDSTSEDPEERRKRIEAQENASNLGAIIGLAVGAIAAMSDTDNTEDTTTEETETPTLKM